MQNMLNKNVWTYKNYKQILFKNIQIKLIKHKYLKNEHSIFILNS